MEEMRFDGRVAVITGAGRGIGRSHALLLASKGARVLVNDLGGSMRGEGADDTVARQVVDEIRAAGGEAVANTDTVATAAGGEAIVAAALEAFGRIDILIHNAGILFYRPIRELSSEDFRSLVDVHLMGAFHVVKPAFPHMCDAGYGRIVLTSSIGGIYGTPYSSGYGSAKAGLIGLGNVVALEGEEHNVKCNLIVPGAVTRMSAGIDTSAFPPMGPETISPLVGWLAHEDCPVSGEIFASIAGRIARIYFAETRGAFDPAWTIEKVAAACDAIHAKADPLDHGLHGRSSHMEFSFEMARRGG